AQEKDPLPDAKARLQVEAQRVEKEFTDGRALAYKLVRSDRPDAVAAVAKLSTLLTMVREDTSLKPARRELLIKALTWDLDEVKRIAADRRATYPTDMSRTVRDDVRRTDAERRGSEAKRAATDAENILASRGRAVGDGSRGRRDSSERIVGVMRETEKSAVP